MSAKERERERKNENKKRCRKKSQLNKRATIKIDSKIERRNTEYEKLIPSHPKSVQ